jgi:hypothetical protein
MDANVHLELSSTRERRRRSKTARSLRLPDEDDPESAMDKTQGESKEVRLDISISTHVNSTQGSYKSTVASCLQMQIGSL